MLHIPRDNKELDVRADKLFSVFGNDIYRLERNLERKLNHPTSATNNLFTMVESRGGLNLISNGSGEFGNNKNFSRFNYYSQDTNGMPGAFTTSTLNADFQIDDLIAIEPGGRYRFQYDIRTVNKVGSSLYYPYIASYDVEHQYIGLHNLAVVHFRLDRAWKASSNQLVIHQADRAKFQSAYNTIKNIASNFLLCEDSYTNRYGYKFPVEVGTYTRKYYTFNEKVAALSYDNQNGVLFNLKVNINAFPPGTRELPAGTQIALTIYGATYNYFSGYTNKPVSTEWTTVKHDFTTEASTRKGTAAIRPGWLLNRNSQAGNQVAITNVALYKLND